MPAAPPSWDRHPKTFTHPDSCTAATTCAVAIFNHLGGAREQPSWDVKAERLGGLKVDNELQSSWKLDREVGDGDALQYFVMRPPISTCSR